MSEAAALVALAATLAAAVARPRWAPDWAVSAVGAGALALGGALSGQEASASLRHLGPTVAFLAALLVLAYLCRQAGVFAALGAAMAAQASGQPRRLLALVFLAAAVTTTVLSLDATVVLLTPVVFATAARLSTSSRPHVYACTHLANSGSLLLPVSNLTNLLAFQALSISFVRFGGLMMLPWLAAIAIEWVVLSRVYRSELAAIGPSRLQRLRTDQRRSDEPLPLFALGVLAAMLVGFGFSSLIGVPPVWFAVAGVLVLAARERPSPLSLAQAAEPGFLVFVLALGMIVRTAGDHGLSSAVDSLVPHGTALVKLLAIAGIGAMIANLLNNLPATLILLPAAAASGPAGVLAMLIGVNVGPNLTYTGSLATLLWRRIVHAHADTTDLVQFTRLGLLTVPAALAACTACLWLALQVMK